MALLWAIAHRDSLIVGALVEWRYRTVESPKGGQRKSATAARRKVERSPIPVKRQVDLTVLNTFV